MKRFTLIAAMIAALFPNVQVSAQVNAVLPVTCNPNSPGDCVKATPVVNPDGTSIGGGSGGGGNTTDVQGNGTLALATANATYPIALSGGRSAVGLTVNGLTGSGATITVERSNDGGTTWTNANTTESSATASLSSTITANGQARVGVAGATNIRLRVSTTGTGTATINYNATAAAGPVFLIGNLPSYSTPDGRIIGGVDNRFINGTAISTGTGATDAGTQRFTLPTDSGLATSGGQTTGNNSLSSLNTSTGGTTDAACTTADATACSAIALYKEMVVKWNAALTAYNTIIANQNATAAGTSATSAQGVQGVTGGVPVTIGGVGADTPPTAVPNGQRQTFWIDRSGATIISPRGTVYNLTTSDGGNYTEYQTMSSGGNTGVFANLTRLWSGSGNTSYFWRGTPDGLAAMQMGLGATALGGAASTTVLGSAANQFKSTTGNVASINLVNGTSAGFLAVLDVTAAPAPGATITAAQLKYCLPIAASAGLDKVFQVPLNLASGIHVALLTSCTTYTTVTNAPVSLTAQFK